MYTIDSYGSVTRGNVLKALERILIVFNSMTNPLDENSLKSISDFNSDPVAWPYSCTSTKPIGGTWSVKPLYYWRHIHGIYLIATQPSKAPTQTKVSIQNPY